ncbi:MAG: hypothetical protein LC657_17845, partial [Desulfobacteraceae bacterium]|nr:hypothetical protein [Desulfobacteraceae bacterium]
GSHADTSIRSTLGYYEQDDELVYPQTTNGPIHANITIDDTNDTLDFEEIDPAGVSSGPLKAFISHGTYTDMNDLVSRIKTAMEAVSPNDVDYAVTYDNAANPPGLSISSQPGDLSELRLFGDTDVDSINDTLGFDLDRTGDTSYGSSSAPVLMTFDATNSSIDFLEKNSDGITSEQINIEIPQGKYTDLDDVALALENAMQEASPNQIAYAVDYDYGTRTFTIKGSDPDLHSFSLLWKTGTNTDNSAAETLGMDPTQDDVMVFGESDKDVINLTIDNTNNLIDFQELPKGIGEKGVDTLTAMIKTKTYTTYTELAHEIEKSLEKQSHDHGSNIDYTVSWDDHTNKFTIKENGSRLEELRLLWQSGENAPLDQGGTGMSIGPILGFD